MEWKSTKYYAHSFTIDCDKCKHSQDKYFAELKFELKFIGLTRI